MVALYLNTLKPAAHSKKAPKRLGRGIGSGLGKTSGKGHKGQHARSGGFHKLGFEGGQTPQQRRRPKFGFHSRTQRFNQEVRLSTLNQLSESTIDLEVLKKAGVLGHHIRRVKIINTGQLTKPVHLKGLAITASARGVIETLGGSVEV